jgi:hypothetical protein
MMWVKSDDNDVMFTFAKNIFLPRNEPWRFSIFFESAEKYFLFAFVWCADLVGLMVERIRKGFAM